MSLADDDSQAVKWLVVIAFLTCPVIYMPISACNAPGTQARGTEEGEEESLHLFQPTQG